MDIDSFAAQTAFELMEMQLPDGGREQVIALVDVGASMMNINVLRNNQSVYMREQPFGGNQLTQEIQRHYNLSPEEAEAAKRNGGLPDTYEAEVLQPFMDTLALGGDARAAVLLHLHAVQPGQSHLPVGRLRHASPASTRWWPSAPKSTR